MGIILRFPIYIAATICNLPYAAAAELPAFVNDISAGTIAVISDGDFVAQTYATGRLAPPEAGYRDMLTILSQADGRIVSSRIAFRTPSRLRRRSWTWLPMASRPSWLNVSASVLKAVT